MTDSPPPDRTDFAVELGDDPPSAFAWPQLSPDRVAQAVLELAAGVQEPSLRAQLHSLAVAAECLGAQLPQTGDGLGEPQRDLESALASGDEAEVVAAARRLAAGQRSLVPAVDWSAVSGG